MEEEILSRLDVCLKELEAQKLSTDVLKLLISIHEGIQRSIRSLSNYLNHFLSPFQHSSQMRIKNQPIKPKRHLNTSNC